ncbi:hypothetical protein QYF36_015313 [Acer negundo]|nr:hypothetical protein QYF36_015313 [Acer negundo]
MVKEVYAKAGSPINIGEQMFLTVLNVIMRMTWGASLNEEDSIRVGIQFRQVVDGFVCLCGAPIVSDLFPVLARFDLQGVESKVKKLSSWFDKMFESLIDSRAKDHQAGGENKKEKGSNKDFLDILLDDKTSLSMNQVKALLLDTFLGGTHTTSTTIEWLMAELLQDPEIMRKAGKELEEDLVLVFLGEQCLREANDPKQILESEDTCMKSKLDGITIRTKIDRCQRDGSGGRNSRRGVRDDRRKIDIKASRSYAEALFGNQKEDIGKGNLGAKDPVVMNWDGMQNREGWLSKCPRFWSGSQEDRNRRHEVGENFHNNSNVREEKFKRDVNSFLSKKEVDKGYTAKVVVEMGKKVLQRKFKVRPLVPFGECSKVAPYRLVKGSSNFGLSKGPNKDSWQSKLGYEDDCGPKIEELGLSYNILMVDVSEVEASSNGESVPDTMDPLNVSPTQQGIQHKIEGPVLELKEGQSWAPPASKCDTIQLEVDLGHILDRTKQKIERDRGFMFYGFEKEERVKGRWNGQQACYENKEQESG